MHHPELEPRFREVFDRVQTHLENSYEIPVIISDVPNPFTGDLDGAEIRIDYDLCAEDSLFILVHLFGHTVQWNLSAAARDIGTDAATVVSEERLQAIEQYELEACAYSLQLFHNLGIHDLDQWLSDFATCDLRYLMHFYRSGGEKRPFFDFWREGSPRIEGRPIPHFRPTRWVSRADGVVV